MKSIFTIALLLVIHFNVFGTCSTIIIIDKETGNRHRRASCTRNCYGIGQIIPGKGAMIIRTMAITEIKIIFKTILETVDHNIKEGRKIPPRLGTSDGENDDR